MLNDIIKVLDRHARPRLAALAPAMESTITNADTPQTELTDWREARLTRRSGSLVVEVLACAARPIPFGSIQPRSDPGARTVEWFQRGPDGFRPADASAILGITSEGLASAIDWPA